MSSANADAQAVGAAVSTGEPVAHAARNEWAENWPLVLTSMIGTALCVVHLYSFGIFLVPISEAFDMSRTLVSSALSIISIVSVTCSPFIGYVIDRVGPRRIGIPGAVLYCCALSMMALFDGQLWQWWATWFLIGVGALLIKPTVWTAAVATYFNASRGLAFAMTLVGTSVCAVITPVLANALLHKFGWRLAYPGLALIWGLLVIPLAVALFYSADDRDRTGTNSRKTHKRGKQPGFELREALLSPRFRALGLSIFLTTIAITGLMIHYVPIVTSKGLSATEAATLAGVIGVCSIIGRLATGVLFDHINGRIVGVAACLLPTLAAALLAFSDITMASAALIAGIVGLALGSETDVAAYLASRYFGTRFFGTVFGSYVGIIGLGVGIGPMLAAGIFDWTGTYHPFFWLVFPVCAAGAALVASLGRYPVFDIKS